jgi:YD repeat-containing protein
MMTNSKAVRKRHQVTGVAGMAAPGYDPAGNMTFHPQIGTLAYDAESRQTSFLATGKSGAYVYDGQGRRVRRTPTGTGDPVTIYAYDAFGKLAAEYSPTAPSGTGGTFYRTTDHLGSTRSWEGIRRHGLLSTTALLDLFEIDGSRRQALETVPRSQIEEIYHHAHGRALLRDQKPLNPRKLQNALDDGLTVGDWCRLLNRKVFFWGPEDRLAILRGASEYRLARQTIVVVDSAALVEAYGDSTTLCHMNSGTTSPIAHRRGRQTFRPIDEFSLDERRRKYGPKRAVAEVTLPYSVPDIADFVVEVYEVGGDEPRRDLS